MGGDDGLSPPKQVQAVVGQLETAQGVESKLNGLNILTVERNDSFLSDVEQLKSCALLHLLMPGRDSQAFHLKMCSCTLGQHICFGKRLQNSRKL